MNDDQPWQAPGQPRPPVPPAPPVTPIYGPPSSVPAPPPPVPLAPPAPLGPAGVPPNSAAPGWTPPPKPGLIPLRPLDLGTMLGAAFRVLRRNPKPTLGVSLLVQAVVTVVTLLVVGGATFASLLRVQSAAPEDQSALVAGSVAFSVVSGLLAVLLGVVASAWLQGIIVIEVARASLGEKLNLRGLWGHAKGRFLALLGWSLLVGLVLVVAVAIIAGGIVVLVATLGQVGIALGIGLGIFGGLGLLVVGIWISTKLSLVPSALMVERLPLRGAIARSWTLTRGYFWKVFGIQLLVAAILGLATNILSVPFAIVAGILGVLVDPNGTGSQTAIIVAIVAYIVQLALTLVLSAITAVIATATTALIYLDLRMRTEGLDLKLTAFVEARQLGETELENPYLPDPRFSTSPTQPPA